MPFPIHGHPSFQNTHFIETKNVFKLMVFITFLKQAMSNFFRSNGLDITLLDNETHFSLFSDDFLQQSSFLRLLDHLETLPGTIQNVKNSPRRPPPT